MKEIAFSRPADELSCIIGNLFATVQPPCDIKMSDALVICGMTHSNSYARLIVKKDCCIFKGEPSDLAAVLNGRCPERRCRNG